MPEPLEPEKSSPDDQPNTAPEATADDPASPHKPRFVPRHRARSVKVECRRGAAGSSNNIGKALIDVSENGARLTVKEAVDEGRVVELRMFAKGENRPVVVLGKVIRCEPMEEGGFSLGVKFDRHIQFADLRRLT